MKAVGRVLLSPAQARLLRGLKVYGLPFAKQKALIDAVDKITDLFVNSFSLFACIALHALAIGLCLLKFE